MSIPLLPVALAGGALLLFASGSKAKTTSSSPSPSPGAGPSPSPSSSPASALAFQDRIADALSKGDAARLMAIADEMQAAGLVAEAQALRASAQGLLALGALGSGGKPPAVPSGAPVVAPSPALPNPPVAAPPPQPQAPPAPPLPPFSSTSPGLPPIVAAPPVSPVISVPPLVIPAPAPLPQGTPITSEQQRRQAVAQSMAVNLRNTSRYHEDQSLVRAFQAQESPAAGSVDGLYGPKTGLALIQYGIVPPRPRYWSSKTMKTDKQNWTARMVRESQSDPARAADWLASSKVANDPAR